MNNSNRKEYSPILVGMVILLLVILIVAPPLFRVMFPKEEVSNKVQKTNSILICNKSSSTETYNVVSKTLYINNFVSKNTINFILNNNFNESQNEAKKMEEKIYDRNISEELDFFNKIDNINKKENETAITFIIDKDLIAKHSSNLELSNYLLDINEQKEFYLNLGYTCTIEKI